MHVLGGGCLACFEEANSFLGQTSKHLNDIKCVAVDGMPLYVCVEENGHVVL